MILDWTPPRTTRFLLRNIGDSTQWIGQIETLRARHPHRPIALALLGGGAIEFWILRRALKAHFGESFFPHHATRLPSIFIQDSRRLGRRIASFFGIGAKPVSRLRSVSEDLYQGRCAVLNFDYRDRQEAFDTPLGEKELAYLQNHNPSLIVVPLVWVWQRRRNLDKSAVQDLPNRLLKLVLYPLVSSWSFVLGDPYQPTFIRKLVLLLIGYTHVFIRAGQELTFEGENTPKTLRRKVLMEIQQEKRVLLGPSFRSTRFIGESLFRDAGFQDFIRLVSVEEGSSELPLFKRAQKYFNEMSSKYSHSMLDVASWGLKKIFNSLYDGISTSNEEFETLRKLSKEGPLVFVPSHKSYLDFLLLSHIMHDQDLSPPHVIAGSNLNFWPMGGFFKRGGAIFIRRSFRGNLVYGEVLRRYVGALLNNRINLEFFIEGMRSRTGKLMPPRYGILKMIVDSYLQKSIQEKVRIVPVSICYDRVTEDQAHRKELEGGEKIQENFVNTVKSAKVLFKNYGRVELNIGKAIELETWLDEQVGESAQSNSTVKLAISKLAFEISHRINTVTPVTAVGLVCACLLAKPEASMTRSELDFWLDLMRKDLESLGAKFTRDLRENFARACGRALARLLDDKILEKFYTGTGHVGLRVLDSQRVSALYYKNSVIHALIAPAVAGLSCDAKTGELRKNEVLELRSLLQFEFFFAEKEDFVVQCLRLHEQVNTEYYAYMLDDVLETVQIGLMGLKEMKDLTLNLKEWKARLLKRGKGFLSQKIALRRESVNTQGFQSFIDMAIHRHWIYATQAEGDLYKVTKPADLDTGLQRILYYRAKLKSWESVQVPASHENPIGV